MAEKDQTDKDLTKAEEVKQESAKEEKTEQKDETVVLKTKSADSATAASKPAGRNNTVLYVVIGLVVLCICCCGIGFVASRIIADNAARSIDNQISNDLTGATGNVESVNAVDKGRTKTAGDYSVTLNDVRKDGDNYIFDLSIKNNDTTRNSFSTLLQLDLKSEKDDSYAQNFFYERGDNESLDREIAAGATIKGKIIFTVADNPTNLDLVVDGGILSDSTAVFDIK